MDDGDAQKTKKELLGERQTLPVQVIEGETGPAWSRRVEQVLQESEERYRSLVELSPETILVHSDWRVVYINPAGLALFAADRPDAIVGMSVLDLMHPDYRALAETRARASYDHLRSADLIEEKILRLDGQTRDVEAATAPIIYQGKPATQAMLRDITARKQAEEALRIAHTQLAVKATELEEANAELTQYAYVASHDLRAPLRAIRNYTDFLSRDLAETLQGKHKRYLDGLGEAVRGCEALVDDLLQLSRVSSRQLQYEAIALGPFLRDLVDALNVPPDVVLEWGEHWPTVQGEPTLLRQIFQNLILNGIKFNQSVQKRVAIGIRGEEAQCYEVFIRDNGIGIEPRHQERIFRPFQRLHTSEEYEGTGMGLTIVKKAVSRLRGTVRLESLPGNGSTFFVSLPRTYGGEPQ